jgi:hypothetical protein
VAIDANGNSVSSGDIWISAATTTVNANVPSLTITSPTVGQAWMAGTTQQITWIAQNINTGEYQIYLNNLSMDGDSALTELAPSIPNGTNSFSWTIPSNLSPGLYKYKMEVTSPETGINAVSQPLSIVAPPNVSPLSGTTTSSAVEAAAEGRDANRISDLITLKTAINLYAVDTVNPIPCSDSKTIYASAPIMPPVGWKAGANMGSTAIDGTGWLPVNFAAISSGAPIAKLPVDPVNSAGRHLVYLFACNPTAINTYELDVVMESQKYGNSGSSDVVSTDGGNDPNVYEVGNNLSLIPDNFWGQ